MPKDQEQLAHLEWLGYVQPVGLVVSIPALLNAQAQVNRNIAPEHQRFLSYLPRDRRDDVIAEIRSVPAFTQQVLGWEAADLIPIPNVSTLPEDLAALEVVLPEYHETLRPTYVVREFDAKDGQKPWLMLVQEVASGTDLDKSAAASERQWHASPQAKFERLLRETEVPIGLLVNDTHLRLIYAPRGESSGFMTFSVAEMAQVAGRPIFAGLHLLLSAERLFTLPEKQRLPAILAESRKYQNTVSTQLAQQVLAALYDLLRGLQAANDQRHGELLRDVLANDPNHVYAGLLTVLMRLVFILYAEDRGLLPGDPVYANYYSVTGLFERLRADAARFPDTMDLRYGAWAQLLTLFRLMYEGGSHGDMHIPARQGYLFDPDRYVFLEGRLSKKLTVDSSQLSDKKKLVTPSLTTNNRQLTTILIPRIADGVIHRVLTNLLILDGERLSYRSLDVEQIGSVYETIIGFNLEVAQGRSIAIRPTKSHGAPSTINLEALLATKATDRAKWLRDQTDQKLTGQAATALKDATGIDAVLAALDRKIDKNVTPNVVPTGSMVFQPSDERRQSGSHYTPRSLTEPIVRTTLKPVLEKLSVDSSQLSGKKESVTPSLTTDNRQLTTTPVPTPEQLLNLKVCDPAMGSGAFLVEVCRQLGDELVKAWHAHDCLPLIPPDEDEILHARRLIAQRCLYGVDKNPMAVDLAKLSLWLTTLAQDHPFTFLDHSLRCGDSLVGLTKEHIASFHWNKLSVDSSQLSGRRKKTAPPPPTTDNQQLTTLFADPIAEKMKTVTEYRQRILAARDVKPYAQLRQELALADEALSLARFTGNLVISAFFSASKDRERAEQLNALARQLVTYFSKQVWTEDVLTLNEAVDQLRSGDRPVEPFHWEIEFPEVFGRENGGFDAIVGNPPFAGKNTLINSHRDGYLDWLKIVHDEAHGNSDLVAHFYRRAFSLLRHNGCFGLIATNTIGQGDTRSTGLRWICTHSGTIYVARRRYRWPGVAAVVVSVVHVCRGKVSGTLHLDGRDVPQITAYLFHAGGHDDPAKLYANEGKSFIGSYVLGMGFTFDDTDTKDVASPIARMHELIAQNPRNAERIFPYIGGQEVNESPTHAHHRYVINFGEMNEEEACQWPDLMRIVVEKVKPERAKLGNNADARRRKEKWWLWGRYTPSLFNAIRGPERLLVIPRVTQYAGFTFLPPGMIFSEQLVVFALQSDISFCMLQSRIHEIWARFLASSMKDDLRYTPSDCFETFPFPEHFETNERLEAVGKAYYDFRAQLMIASNEGLTKIYNRFHDPNERSPEIQKLRGLHNAMDRAVLDAYGWTDLVPTCEFLLDYEEDEDEDDSSSRRKKPWRYRWPDDFRDEVLARLLDLNAQRAELERLAGLTAEAAIGKSKGRKQRAVRGEQQKLW